MSWTFDVSSGCLGALTPGNEAFVMDQATGLRLGPGELGEICVKTMTCMKVIRIIMISWMNVMHRGTSTTRQPTRSSSRRMGSQKWVTSDIMMSKADFTLKTE